MDPHLIECLPSIHSLTSCDTTSKVGNKVSVLTRSVDLSLIQGFGKNVCTETMLMDAEQFLLQLIGKADHKTFDDYRHTQFYDAAKYLTLKSMVCCSSSVKLHIKRSYLQTNMWINAPEAAPALDPLEYGYKKKQFGLRPLLAAQPIMIRPPDLPEACKCKTCVRKTCICQKNGLSCVSYCNCDPCHNPIKA